MAYDAEEIGRLRAAVPDNFKPQADAGVLSLRFRESERYNIGLALIGNADLGDQANPGFLLPAALANARRGRLERKHAEQRSREEYATLARLKAALDARLAQLDAELAAIDRRLDEIRDRREKIGDQLEALDELDRLSKSGKLDPSNPAHARLLRLAGITDDEARGGDLAAIILRRRGDLDREDSGLETEWNANMKRRGEVIAERRDVVAARDEIETANTSEARILAERRATTVLGAQQLGEASYQTDSARAKQVAASAVAATEREGARGESESVTRDSIASRSATYRGDLDSFTP